MYRKLKEYSEEEQNIINEFYKRNKLDKSNYTLKEQEDLAKYAIMLYRMAQSNFYNL